LPKCLDDICTTSVKPKRYDDLEAAYAQETALSPGWGMITAIHRAPMQAELAVADTAAEKYNEDSKMRKAQKPSDTSAFMGILAQAIYTKQCKDLLCAENVAALAAQMAPRAKEIATAAPYQDTSVTNKKVNSEFVPKFVAEIDASKNRAEMKNAAAVQKQVSQTRGPKPTVPGTQCKTLRCR
jgi:hypothetical protein